jgi:hypothetical protein
MLSVEPALGNLESVLTYVIQILLHKSTVTILVLHFTRSSTVLVVKVGSYLTSKIYYCVVPTVAVFYGAVGTK